MTTSSPEPALPQPGEVIRYAYLWTHDRDAGREEAVKDRPCVVLLVQDSERGEVVVIVLPITSRPPDDPTDAIPLPPVTRQRLGLQDERCWVVLTEVNRFVWPGPDLRPVGKPSGAFYSYGLLPAKLFRAIRNRVVERARQRRLQAVPRTA